MMRALVLIGLSSAGAFAPGALPTVSAGSHTLSHVSMTVPLGLRMEVNSFLNKVPEPKSRLSVTDTCDAGFLVCATFFQKANQMSEAEVKTVKSSAVRKAYERAHVCNMPREVKQSYWQDDAKYGGYSKELERVRRETAERVGRETAERVGRETTKEIVISMLAAGMSEAQIAPIVKQTEEVIRSIRASGGV